MQAADVPVCADLRAGYTIWGELIHEQVGGGGRTAGGAAMPSLQVLKGPNEGAVIPLEGERLVLGRNPDCAVVIPITAVSREHARILRVGGQYYIEDRESR